MSFVKGLSEKLKKTPFLQDRLTRQKVIFGSATLCAFFIFLCFSGEKPDEKPERKQDTQKFFDVPKPTKEGDVVSFEGAASAAPREEVWVRRMEGQASAMQDQNKDLQAKLDLMTKKVDVLEKMLATTQEEPLLEEKVPDNTTKSTSEEEMVENPLDLGPDAFIEKQATSSFPAQPMGGTGGILHPGATHGPGAEGSFKTIAVIKRKEMKEEAPLVEGTIPGGTRVTGVMLSGLAVSTSTNSQADPHPVIIRVRSDFLMPRGFSAPLKDAVVIGQCYGDRSAERAFCTLETLSYVEGSGEIVEEKIQGWVFGEDGRYGLQGEIVDRSDALLRDSFLAGLAGGMANFFQGATTNQVFPVSPFGQTNALKPSEMLEAGGASGVGQALDRLAKFYIDAAEKMSPVLLVNPGREVDIVLKSKLDFAKSVYRKSRVRLSKNARLRFAKEHADDTQITQVRKDLE